MAKKISKNLQKVKDQLDGTYKGKIQVGMHTSEDVHANRKVGDKWTDSEGVEWEQKQGYRSKINKTPDVGMFSKVCKDCEKPCTSKVDKETYNRMSRCMYCQIDFEAKLKTWPIKYWAWIKLQALQRWTAMDREILQYLEEKEKVNQQKRYDTKVMLPLEFFHSFRVEGMIALNRGSSYNSRVFCNYILITYICRNIPWT